MSFLRLSALRKAQLARSAVRQLASPRGLPPKGGGESDGSGIQRAWICRDCDSLHGNWTHVDGGNDLYHPENLCAQGRANLLRAVAHSDRRVLSRLHGVLWN